VRCREEACKPEQDAMGGRATEHVYTRARACEHENKKKSSRTKNGRDKRTHFAHLSLAHVEKRACGERGALHHQQREGHTKKCARDRTLNPLSPPPLPPPSRAQEKSPPPAASALALLAPPRPSSGASAGLLQGGDEAGMEGMQALDSSDRWCQFVCKRHLYS